MPQRNICRLQGNLMRKEDCSLRVWVIGPTWALTCILTTVSATCWGGCTWQILQNASEDYWSHVQITSNGDTDDSCFHKCFSLGLSWFVTSSSNELSLQSGLKKKKSLFLIEREILVRDTLQLGQLSDFNIKKVLYSWVYFSLDR